MKPATDAEIAVWFDGDYSECWYGTGLLTKETFAAIVNADEFMQGEEPCKPEDVQDTLAKNVLDAHGEVDRFYLKGSKDWDERDTEPYPILVWRPI